jgi:hypothetical protein
VRVDTGSLKRKKKCELPDLGVGKEFSEEA